MRILVSWGTEMGGTEGIARIVAETLEQEGFEVSLVPASRVDALSEYDGAVIGGALYMNRWHKDARRMVERHAKALRGIPVWFFSSGPLDNSAEQRDIPPVQRVEVLMERIGACGHQTFGGRLPADAKGFPAAQMARTHAGDWRNPEHIRAWARDVARALPQARPRPAVEPTGRSLPRLGAHALAAWAGAALVFVLLQLASTGLALTARVVVVPGVFAGIAVHYFRARGARAPAPSALVMVLVAAVLDVAVLGGILVGDAGFFATAWPGWLPLVLGFVAAWMTGAIMGTMPWQPPEVREEAPRGEVGPGNLPPRGDVQVSI